MISITLIIIASICNAIMDILAHKYAWSIFHKYNYTFDSRWWNPKTSWSNKYNNPWYIPTQFSDAWHTFKTIMIFSLLGAIILFKIPYVFLNEIWINNLIWYGIIGILWNLIFSLFYDKILRE